MPKDLPGPMVMQDFARRIRDLFLNQRFAIKTTHMKPISYETPFGLMVTFEVTDPIYEHTYDLILRPRS